MCIRDRSYIGDHISHLLPDGYAAHTLRHRFATTAYAATHDLFAVSYTHLNTVATSSSKGELKFNAHFGSGISTHNCSYS